MSNDNKNPEATVTLRAFDRDMNVIDMHDYHGTHEPAFLLMDFMNNTQANYRHKIIRYTMEIAYVIVCGLFFLSSTHAEAALAPQSGRLSYLSRSISDGFVLRTGDYLRGRCLFRLAAARPPFPEVVIGCEVRRR